MGPSPAKNGDSSPAAITICSTRERSPVRIGIAATVLEHSIKPIGVHNSIDDTDARLTNLCRSLILEERTLREDAERRLDMKIATHGQELSVSIVDALTAKVEVMVSNIHQQFAADLPALRDRFEQEATQRESEAASLTQALAQQMTMTEKLLSYGKEECRPASPIYIGAEDSGLDPAAGQLRNVIGQLEVMIDKLVEEASTRQQQHKNLNGEICILREDLVREAQERETSVQFSQTTLDSLASDVIKISQSLIEETNTRQESDEVLSSDANRHRDHLENEVAACQKALQSVQVLCSQVFAEFEVLKSCFGTYKSNDDLTLELSDVVSS